MKRRKGEMKRRKGQRLSVEAVSELIKAGASDDAILEHYRQLHFDTRMVALTIRRCKIKLKLMKPREAVYGETPCGG